jgi:1-acyl-sn-glycerol-3-phosphate acyltransferase
VRSWFFRPGATIVGVLVRIFGGARIEGLEHVPRTGAFVLAANHASLADPPIIGWAVGHRTGRVIHFMAKVEMRSWPVAGWLATQSGVIFVRRGERDRAAQTQALALLRGGSPVGMFPEGTRSTDGRLQPGRPGTAFLALRSGAPILPVGISGTHRLFPRGARFPRRAPMAVRVGPPFDIGHQPAGRLDRELLADGTNRIMAAIAELLPKAQRPR